MAAFLYIQNKLHGRKPHPCAGVAKGKGLAKLCRLTGLIPFPLCAKEEMAV